MSTFGDRPTVTLYNLDKVNDIKEVKTCGLAKNTGWFSDREAKVNGEIYYRVDSHEWVKAKDVYIYEAINAVIHTKDGSYKFLTDAHQVSNKSRALGSLIKKHILMITYIIVLLTMNSFIRKILTRTKMKISNKIC